MSAEHNHPPKCCCPVLRGEAKPTGRERPGEHWNARLMREEAEGRAATACLGCPKHGVCICDLARSEPLDHKAGSHHEAFCPRFRATPYTEQETTNG